MWHSHNNMLNPSKLKNSCFQPQSQTLDKAPSLHTQATYKMGNLSCLVEEALKIEFYLDS